MKLSKAQLSKIEQSEGFIFPKPIWGSPDLPSKKLFHQRNQ